MGNRESMPCALSRAVMQSSFREMALMVRKHVEGLEDMA